VIEIFGTHREVKGKYRYFRIGALFRKGINGDTRVYLGGLNWLVIVPACPEYGDTPWGYVKLVNSGCCFPPRCVEGCVVKFLLSYFELLNDDIPVTGFRAIDGQVHYLLLLYASCTCSLLKW
jgi:hypothetical protein